MAISSDNTTLLISYARDQDIRPLFELLGIIAKANGVVSKESINQVERFIALQLSASQRKFAIDCFRSGKELPLMKGVITKRAFQLYGFQLDSDVERWLEPVQILDILLRVGMADGRYSDERDYVVESARSTFAFPVRLFWTMRSTIAEYFNVDKATFKYFKADSTGDSSEHARNANNGNNKRDKHKTSSILLTKREACSILKVEEVANIQEIKVAYRKLVKLYHPDMRSKSDATESELEESIRNFCMIQDAYEYLVDHYIA